MKQDKIDKIIAQNNLILDCLGQLLTKYPNELIKERLLGEISNIRFSKLE